MLSISLLFSSPALARDKTFRYTYRQLNLVRAAAKRDLTSPRALGLFWLADAQPKKARGYLQDALRLNPQDAEVLRTLSRIEAGQGQVQAAQNLVSKAQKVERSPRPQPWIKRAQLAQAEGNVRVAINMFEKAKALEPENAEALAQVYTASGRLDAAFEVYQSLKLTLPTIKAPPPAGRSHTAERFVPGHSTQRARHQTCPD